MDALALCMVLASIMVLVLGRALRLRDARDSQAARGA